LAIFRHSPGLKGRTSDSSGFSTKEGSAALHTQGMKHFGEWKRRTVRDEADKEWRRGTRKTTGKEKGEKEERRGTRKTIGKEKDEKEGRRGLVS